MKIGIFGNYNYASVGDQAILEGILTQFRAKDATCSCVVFAVDADAVLDTLASSDSVRVVQGIPILPQKSKEQGGGRTFRGYLRNTRRWIEKGASRLPRGLASFARELLYFIHDVELLRYVVFWRQIRQEIQNLDVLLIGGGNLLMDLFRTWPIYLLIYVRLAKISGVPVMFYAVGAGPLSSRLGRFYLGWAARMADMLTFRDKESLGLVAKSLKVEEKKLVLSADPAFCLRSPRQEVFLHRGNGRLRIGMSFVAYYHWSYWPRPNMEIYRKYREAMVRTVQYVLRELDAEFVFFATNTSDIFVAQEVASVVGNAERVQLVERRLTVEETLALLASFHLMIGSRLHSLILSLVASTPAVAFSYQPKVASFYQRVGLSPYTINLDNYLAEPSPEEVVRLLKELSVRGEETQARLQRALNTLREQSVVSVMLAQCLATQKPTDF